MVLCSPLQRACHQRALRRGAETAQQRQEPPRRGPHDQRPQLRGNKLFSVSARLVHSQELRRPPTSGFRLILSGNARHREPRRRDSGRSRASSTSNASRSLPAPPPDGKGRVVSGRSGRSLSGRSGRSRSTSADSHAAGDVAPDDWRWDESHLAWLREHHRRDKRRGFQSQLRDQRVGTVATFGLTVACCG